MYGLRVSKLDSQQEQIGEKSTKQDLCKQFHNWIKSSDTLTLLCVNCLELPHPLNFELAGSLCIAERSQWLSYSSN